MMYSVERMRTVNTNRIRTNTRIEYLNVLFSMKEEKQLLSLKAQVSDLEAVLVEIEKVAKP